MHQRAVTVVIRIVGGGWEGSQPIHFFIWGEGAEGAATLAIMSSLPPLLA